MDSDSRGNGPTALAGNIWWGEEGGLLTAKSGILKSGWIVVTVKMLSDPEKKQKKPLT